MSNNEKIHSYLNSSRPVHYRNKKVVDNENIFSRNFPLSTAHHHHYVSKIEKEKNV